jgi:hypothetical protein
LRRIFGSKREEATGGQRNLHNEELRNLYSPKNITSVIKLRRDETGRHVAAWGRSEVHTGTCCENKKVIDRSEDLGVARRIILK